MSENRPPRPLALTILKIVLPLCLIGAGFAGYEYYKSLDVEFDRKPPEKAVPVVAVMKAAPDRVTTRIRAMGTVQPDRQVAVKAQVAGKVEKVAEQLVQGGLLKKDR